jgi:hypothetical protein
VVIWEQSSHNNRSPLLAAFLADSAALSRLITQVHGGVSSCSRSLATSRGDDIIQPLWSLWDVSLFTCVLQRLGSMQQGSWRTSRVCTLQAVLAIKAPLCDISVHFEHICSVWGLCGEEATSQQPTPLCTSRGHHEVQHACACMLVDINFTDCFR